MAKNWKRFIKDLADDAGILAKDELIALIRDAKKDKDDFLRRQGQKMELYLTQLAEKKITKREFEGYVVNIRDLVRLQARKMRVRARARTQRLAKNIQQLILDSLLRLL